MPLHLIPRKRAVSFADASSNTVHIVENYRLAKMSSPDTRNQTWYKPNEFVELMREDRIDREQQNTALAYKAVAASAARKAACRSKRRPNSRSPIPCTPTELPCSTKKKLFQKKAEILKEIRMVPSTQNSPSTAHKQPKGRTNHRTRATREPVATTMLPSRRDRYRHRYYQIHTNGKNVGRVQAVFYSS